MKTEVTDVIYDIFRFGELLTVRHVYKKENQMKLSKDAQSLFTYAIASHALN